MRKCLYLYLLTLLTALQASAQCDASFTYTINQNQVSFNAAGTSQPVHQLWHFGDGGTGDGFHPVHAYSMPGQYTVLHVVRDSINGCVDSSLQSVTVNFTPTCHVAYTYEGPAAAGTYHFYSQVAITGSTLQHISWTVNGLPVSEQPDFLYTFPQPGVYNVCVNIQSATGCTAQYCDSVRYQPYTDSCHLNTSFTYHIDSTAAGAGVTFSAQPVSPQWHYHWIFGDGDDGNGPVITHFYNPPGTYYVTLIVTDSVTHCFNYVSDSVTINPPSPPPADSLHCNAAFGYVIDQHHVSFTTVANGPHIHHSWLFGDGSSSANVDPGHTYNQAGQYTVIHIISDSIASCVDTVVHVITITASSCSVGITFTHPEPLSGTYNFHAATSATASAVQHFVWTINGTPSAATENFSHTFTQPGNYEICVTIETTTGCTAHNCIVIHYQPYTDSCDLHASFTYRDDSTQPRRIYFTGLPDRSQLHYQWSFGDGTAGVGRLTSHLYAHSGTYHVKLLVTDSIHYCYDSIAQNITVTASSDSCTAALSYAISATGTVAFAAVSNQVILSQVWMIIGAHDSVTLHAFNPVYTFADTGRYYVCVIITTINGCMRSVCEHITINHTGRTGRLVASYPNPVSAGSVVRVNISMASSARISYSVADLAGNIVYQSQQQGMAGNNIITIPVQQLLRGQYFIDISFGQEKRRSVFQKL